MWYKTEEATPPVGVDIGPVTVTWHAVYTGLILRLNLYNSELSRLHIARSVHLYFSLLAT